MVGLGVSSAVRADHVQTGGDVAALRASDAVSPGHAPRPSLAERDAAVGQLMLASPLPSCAVPPVAVRASDAVSPGHAPFPSLAERDAAVGQLKLAFFLPSFAVPLAALQAFSLAGTEVDARPAAAFGRAHVAVLAENPARSAQPDMQEKSQ